ncbi:hypothetical protein, partial [Acinetobacter baumannii]|uniref:hypothetical protein n=1 Tax=Acinetobacter baumannii TaxID=470 RepID=UPI001BC88CE3
LKRWLLHKYLKIRTTLPFVYLCNKAPLLGEKTAVIFCANVFALNVKQIEPIKTTKKLEFFIF